MPAWELSSDSEDSDEDSRDVSSSPLFVPVATKRKAGRPKSSLVERVLAMARPSPPSTTSPTTSMQDPLCALIRPVGSDLVCQVAGRLAAAGASCDEAALVKRLGLSPHVVSRDLERAEVMLGGKPSSPWRLEKADWRASMRDELELRTLTFVPAGRGLA